MRDAVTILYPNVALSPVEIPLLTNGAYLTVVDKHPLASIVAGLTHGQRLGSSNLTMQCSSVFVLDDRM